MLSTVRQLSAEVWKEATCNYHGHEKSSDIARTQHPEKTPGMKMVLTVSFKAVQTVLFILRNLFPGLRLRDHYMLDVNIYGI